MAYPNPAINPPVLHSSRRRLHSRSPSRSPVRQVRDADPLLRDLSPTTTLRAFTLDSGNRHDSGLADSFEHATPSERALGAKAAQTCLDLRSWCRELGNWEWSGTFEVPEQARVQTRLSVMSLASMASARTGAGRSSEDDQDEEEEYWGSLPGKTARAYEQRVDELLRDLERMDVEQLKDFVLSVHRQVPDGHLGMQTRLAAIEAHTDLRRLDDFTALITATILQALPYLSQLNWLLEIWQTRLNVLRQTPAYLRDLKQARTDLDHGWAAIAVQPSSGGSHSSAVFTRETMGEMQRVVQQQVTSLGSRLDGFLDELEGSEETVPEAWIEEFETLEEAYGEWVVQAERKVLENEWRSAREQEMRDVERSKTEQALTAGALPTERLPTPSYRSEDPDRDRDSLVIPSSRRTSVTFDLSSEDHVLNPATINQLLAKAESSRASLPRSDFESYTLGADDHARQSDLSRRASKMSNFSTESLSKRTRHIPIVIDYSKPDQIQPIDDSAISVQPQDVNVDSQPPPAVQERPKPGIVQKRAGIFNGNIERLESLQRNVKSPVRPFERASNAFTKLFGKDKEKEKTPEPQARSNSGRSTLSRTLSSASGSRSRSKSKSREERIIWGGREPLAPVSDGPNQQISRSRSASQRSMSDRGVHSSLADPFGLEPKTSGVKDYADLPGGWRPRSRSAESRSRISKSGYQGRERRLERLPEHSGNVETYQPKRLSSPIRPPSAKQQEPDDYPADWPLASPPETSASSPVKERPATNVFPEKVEPVAEEGAQDDSSPEISSPKLAMETDVFDRMFVASLPSTPDVVSEDVPVAIASIRDSLRSRTSSQSRKREVPTLDETMLGTHGRQDDLSVASPLAMQEEGVTEQHDVSPEAEIHDAQRVGYFPVQASPQDEPPTESPVHLSAAEPILVPSRTKSRSPGSPMLLKLEIPVAEPAATDADLDGERPPLIKRASVASIQSHPRSELRSVNVRRSSQGSIHSPPQTPGEPVSAVEPMPKGRSTPTSPLSYKGLVVFPSPPGHKPSLPSSPVSPASSTQSPSKSRFASLPFGALDDEAAESPHSGQSEDETPAPLNAVMAKRKTKTNTAKARTSSPLAKTPLKPGEDTFDRHVSDVIERLPSSAIRFKPRPGAETPQPGSRSAEPRNYAGPRLKGTSRVSSRLEGGGLTLAPAEASPKKAAADEVKLYHLTQAGRDEPIKLFVRLVGEGERVMVRVGGGWADLADYLRQYAEHHGSRTVSGGGIELQTADGTASRKVSTASVNPNTTEPKGRGTPTLSGNVASRPGSRMGELSTVERLSKPQPRFSMGDSTPEDAVFPARVQTPTSNNIAMLHSTPKSTSTAADSRPSTAGSTGRPGSRQGWTESGLAGLPSVKRADLPEQKARWVEGMLERAKAASAEKGKEEKAKYFGEIGKAGGTRRVIFRQNSGGAGKALDENVKPS